MNAETFFEAFDLLAEAPNSVEKLRELILQLAVQGKLVPQDADDEPAEKLLERIAADRQQLVLQRGLRGASDDLPDTDNPPSELPSAWRWARLGNITVFTNGFAFQSGDYQTSGVGIVRIGDIQNAEIVPADMKCVPESFLTSLDLKFRVTPGDLVIAMSGATTGKLGFNRTSQTFLLNQRVGKLELLNIHPNYASYYLATKIQENLRISAGSAIPNLSTEQIKAIWFPVPPYEEQRRIVSKVDELLGLCDELETRQGARRELRERLVQAALDQLLASRDPADFATHWQRLQIHFDRLFDCPETICQLRDAVIQLAVQGKIAPQDPNDVPASEVLAQLASSGGNSKVRRSVPEDVKRPDTLDDAPIPAGWTIESTAGLLRVGAIVDLKDGNHGANHPKTAEFTADGLPFITAAQVSDEGRIDYDSAYKLSGEPLTRLRVGFAKAGDVIYTHKGSVGRVAICDRDCVLSPQTTYYRVNTTVFHKHYLRLYLLSPAFRSQVDQVKGQTTRDFVSIKAQYNFFIRMPPLAEQKRIVVRTNELLSLCEGLEIKLSAGELAGGQLLSAVVHTLLNVRNN